MRVGYQMSGVKSQAESGRVDSWVQGKGKSRQLTDSSGRIMRKLRVSLTDACNFRCDYCMPKDAIFAPSSGHLTVSELCEICSRLVSMGIEELRLTGGEPTLRPDFQAILAALATLPVAKKGITTNGQLLSRHLEGAWDTGWKHLNISLDSLDPGRFERITGGGDFRKVMGAIEKAAAMGFEVKINMVVMRDVNDDELEDFAGWSARSGLEIRFLELMKIGPAQDRHFQRFVSAAEMLTRLQSKRLLKPVPLRNDSTAFVFTTHDGARLGFIASESMPFCGACSRLRLSAAGVLRSCLMDPFGLSLRHAAPEQYPEILAKVMARKPLGRIEQMSESMHMIGG